MNKTILITGSTDGIGLATANSLVKLGHKVIIHGRSEEKINSIKQSLSTIANAQQVSAYKADLSSLAEVKKLAAQIKLNHDKLDAVINNAGVFVVPETVSSEGLDVRFTVNTIAPYLLTQQLLPILKSSSRIINLSSAAQSSLLPDELTKPSTLSDNAVYAKSKLALTMWSKQMALQLGADGPSIIAINPKSFLGSKMVEQAYGVSGGNLEIGADILVKSVLSDEFSDASGKYYDNDIESFSSPHPDANDPQKTSKIVETIDKVLQKICN